ncbi:hypothetical protein AWB71_05330 [Caballeronia peredens]|nr:hypothetical protein AWB71_05330 [Caballeronia peredens]
MDAGTGDITDKLTVKGRGIYYMPYGNQSIHIATWDTERFYDGTPVQAQEEILNATFLRCIYEDKPLNDLFQLGKRDLSGYIRNTQVSTYQDAFSYAEAHGIVGVGSYLNLVDELPEELGQTATSDLYLAILSDERLRSEYLEEEREDYARDYHDDIAEDVHTKLYEFLMQGSRRYPVHESLIDFSRLTNPALLEELVPACSLYDSCQKMLSELPIEVLRNNVDLFNASDLSDYFRLDSDQNPYLEVERRYRDILRKKLDAALSHKESTDKPKLKL